MGINKQLIAKSCLAYIGDRPYIRGGDLYSCFEEGIRQHHSDLVAKVVKRFRMVREVQADGEWVLTANMPSRAAATIEWQDGATGTHIAAFLETGTEITRRQPDLPSFVNDLDCDMAFSGQIQTKALHSAGDFMNAIIEGNKRLHQDTLRARKEDDSSIRLVFIEDFPIVVSGKLKLRFELIGVREAGNRRYSLCRITSPSLGGGLKICYAF